MDAFKVALSIANKQTKNYGFGLVALLTVAGEQIFSSVVFKCPCDELNFAYGMVFLLVPALALLLLGYILNKRTWRLFTGLCQGHEKCSCKKFVAGVMVFWQISTTVMVAPSTWIAVALLNGNYYECSMTGTNVSAFNKLLCDDRSASVECQKELHRFPCSGSSSSVVSQTDRNAVLLTLRAQSQILGWMLIASIMLFNLLLICVARCSSPISYQQLNFWRAYVQEENSMLDTYTVKHAKELAERNLKSFFDQMPPENITTPSNRDWEKISSLFKFTGKAQYYSTMHKYVEKCDDMRTASVRSNDSPVINPAVLSFIDEGRAVP